MKHNVAAVLTHLIPNKNVRVYVHIRPQREVTLKKAREGETLFRLRSPLSASACLTPTEGQTQSRRKFNDGHERDATDGQSGHLHHEAELKRLCP